MKNYILSILILAFNLFSFSQNFDNEKINLLGINPQVPFASIKKDSISSAKKTDCQEWIKKDIIWYNLNKVGKVVGASKVVGKSYYDVTNCYELQLETVSGKDGIGLFTSKEVHWSLDSSQIWAPSNLEKIELDSFVKKLDKLVIDTAKLNYAKSEIKHSIFFKIPINENEDENYLSNTKCVVFGNTYLAIAFINSQGKWTLAHLENEYTNSSFKIFTPVAILDIDKDGIPEIIYKDSLGHVYWDAILQIKNKETINSWHVIAKSIGGATI